jgi:hypothetical protein
VEEKWLVYIRRRGGGGSGLGSFDGVLLKINFVTSRLSFQFIHFTSASEKAGTEGISEGILEKKKES